MPQYIVDRITGDYGTSMSVDGDSSMRHDAVFACRTRIAQDVSMMPVDVVRYVGGTRQDVAPVPQIVAAPSVWVDAMTWRYQIVDSWLGWGNAWGIVTDRTTAGYPLRIELQSPAGVSSYVDGTAVKFFVNGQEHSLFPNGDLWHSPAYTMPGSILGLSPIAYHAQTIRAGLTAEQFGVDFLAGGGHPHAILAPERDPGPDGAATLKERFKAATQGRDVVVVPKSTTYHQIQVSPSDSQFIDTMRYSAEQICRIFGEDPADYGIGSAGSTITYANRSDADLARFKRRQYWVVKLQEMLTAMLPRPQVVRLNTSSSLMMTAGERWALIDLRLRNRTLTVNEARTIEDEAPFGPEFDEPGIPDVVPAEEPDMGAEDEAGGPDE